MMYIGSIVLLAISSVHSFAEESLSNNEASLKRAPMGFQGMRGKKDLVPMEHDELSKRAPMGFQGMRGKKDSVTNDMEDNLLSEEVEKRAPMGFQGMRGKKGYLAPEFEDVYFQEDLEKRAPMGFQGMRGKKAMDEEEYYKRAPMGFQGMRGKKSPKEVLDEIMENGGATVVFPKRTYDKLLFEYPEEYEKRAMMMGFHGMRGKKVDYPAEWEKRAPMGFQGMRGKKTDFLDQMEEADKRALMGLQGTRGNNGPPDNYVNYFVGSFDYDKRAPMGFQGMRGKKDSYKRAPMGFQGMRGKRDPALSYGLLYDRSVPTEYQGASDRGAVDVLMPFQFEKRSPFRFFGSRGKKNPRWEIRGKFVGVRGKKWAPTPYDREDSALLESLFDNIDRIDVEADSARALGNSQ